MNGDYAAAASHAERGLAISLGQPGPVRMPAQLVRALLHSLAQEFDEAWARLREAEVFILSRPGEQWPLIAMFTHLLLDDLPTAAAGLDAVIAHMRSIEALDLLPPPLLMQARAELRRGDFAKARIAANEAAALVKSMGGATSEQGNLFGPDCDALLGHLAALSGDREACERHARSCMAAGMARRVVFVVHGRRALGLLALGEGDFEVAAAQMRELDRVATSAGILETPVLGWLADLAEAQLGVQDTSGARATIDRMAAHAATVRTSASENLLARVRGLADSDAQELASSAEGLAAAGLPFEAARSRLLAGQVLRRSRDIGPAKQQLLGAFDVFDALLLEPWRLRAAAELRACGVAVSNELSPQAKLTPQELQVARLAAGGESNADIARSLFLSKKTVEFHLGNVFRKVGVSRRAQLVRVVPALTS
jgi:DNA-binding CsgD family transcriptional regulator